jgi:hypothetical protein
MKITYNASVRTAAGWRSVTVEALADQVSPGFAQVFEVLAIDGQAPAPTMSRTGAKRQQFWGCGFAASEVGKRKRLSACQ